MKAIRILGIDPGLRITGWGIIESDGQKISYIDHGVIKPNLQHPIAMRLNNLFIHLNKIITLYTPEEAAIEEIFISKNASSSLKLGLARGITLLAPAHNNLKIYEYGANHVKKCIVGQGHAEKKQIEVMVLHLLFKEKQKELPQSMMPTKDAADALAVAISHAHSRTSALFQVPEKTLSIC